jgi:predicted DCC family thiol-disulfide oxidoreductase YuxK
LYDADCGFCRWAVAKILHRDRRNLLRPVALQDQEASRLLPDMNEAERMASWHLVTSEGDVSSAGAAVPPLLRLLPGGTAPAAIAATFPRTTDRLYRWTADHRDWLGRRVGAKACSIDPQTREPQRGRSA